MKRISILVPEAAVMEAIADPKYLFSTANQFLEASGRPPLFQVELVGQKPHIRLADGAYSVYPDKLLAEVTRTDLVIIPAVFGDMKEAVKMNRETYDWIVRQYQQGAEVASLCVGAFLLGATGLLDGKKCSTHWAYYQEFRDTYPKVEVIDGSIITEESRLYSSGGANSYWNLLIYLLEKYTDRDTAILAAKYFAIDIDRESQAAFMMFTGQKNHSDDSIRQSQEYIENNYHDKIAVDEIASRVAINRRSFERRFKKATGNTVVEYMQRVRVEAAKRRFEATRMNINEVMYDVGYTDTKAFRTVFKKITGLTPIEYRNKYQKQLMN